MNTFKQQFIPIRHTQQESGMGGLQITGLGIFDSTGDFNWEQLSPGICVHAIKSGKGVMDRDGEIYEVGKGDLYIFWPNDHIKYYDCPETPWHYEWFRLTGTNAISILNSIGLTRSNPHIRAASFHSFWVCLEEFRHKLRNDAYSTIYSTSAAWQFVNAIAENLHLSQNTTEDQIIAEKCCQIIDNQLSFTININELAEICQVNRSTLFRAFKKQYGISPKEYIDNQRFEKATKLLKLTSLSIKEIAFTCGFEQQYYFSLAFRKRFNTSPSQWRNTAS